MNKGWKSPKEIPALGSYIWILTSTARDEKANKNNRASIVNACVFKDIYKVPYAKAVADGTNYYFYKWNHVSGIPNSQHPQKQIIRGWIPFEGIHHPDSFTCRESREVIQMSLGYKAMRIKEKSVDRNNINFFYEHLVGRCEICHMEFESYFSADETPPLWRKCCGTPSCVTYENYHHKNHQKMMWCELKCKAQDPIRSEKNIRTWDNDQKRAGEKNEG